MKGKEKCKALKEIRQKIAEQNDIAFAVSECTHQGDCRGTCPKCEAELRYLERQLEIRKNLGKAVVVAGISAGMCAPMVACNPIETIGDVIADVYYTINPGAAPMEGAAEYIPPVQLTGEAEEYIPEDVAGEEGPAPESDEPNGEDILGGLEEYDPSEDVESTENDLDAMCPSEEDSEELAGEIPLAPTSEEDLEDIDEYLLEGDIAIDPEYLNEE
ncbi:MAG: hypothetical protein J6A80_06130 [Lachnospiraceae bacterium]|nr:hypothetical protein [Lachnospiraceae bacterium]